MSALRFSYVMLGAGIVDNAPGFVSAASPPSIVDAAGACTGTDIDGDSRPIGGACDLGSDERSP
jgi:hypothetical protein